MKYTAAEVARMKGELARKKTLLRLAEQRSDKREIQNLRNEIRGLEASISGSAN
mgnify:CR=1 FL=1